MAICSCYMLSMQDLRLQHRKVLMCLPFFNLQRITFAIYYYIIIMLFKCDHRLKDIKYIILYIVKDYLL